MNSHRLIAFAAALALALLAPSCSDDSTGPHTHSASDIVSGTLETSRLDMGPGSGLDADLLDGQQAASFAAASHAHDGVYSPFSHNHDAFYASTAHNHDSAYLRLTGGVLTGALTLPSNGLLVGANDLVLSGGMVGIGTTPTNKLEVAGTIYSNVSNGHAVRGQTSDASGAGIYGNSSVGTGVQGISSGANKSGLDGTASGGHGVRGATSSASHSGVYGTSSVGDAIYGQCLGGGSGVVGTTTDANAAGVNGQSAAGHGVYGASTANMRTGVYGLSVQNYGIIGETQNSNFAGVHGFSQVGDGIAGTTQATATAFGGSFIGDVSVQGSLFVSGLKSFVTRHPEDQKKAIIYVCLEAGEVGTYCRGKATLTDGGAVIDLPDHFSAVTSEEGLTAQVTPAGQCNGLFVESLSSKQLVVRELIGGASSAGFHWTVNGIRKGYENYNPVTDSTKIVKRLDDWEKTPHTATGR